MHHQPEDLAFYEAIERLLSKTRSEILPIYLQAPVEELEARVVEPERKAMGKVSSVKGLLDFVDRG